jgi:hypothetical protein
MAIARLRARSPTYETKPRVTLVNLAQLDWIRRSGRVGVSESDKRVTRE